MTRLPLLLIVTAMLVVSTSCGDDSTTPTVLPSNPRTELFVGTLEPLGTTFYSFSATETSSISLTLGSLTASSTGSALSRTLTMSIGRPEGTGCKPTQSIATTPSISAQLTTVVDAGVYCIGLADGGSLTGSTDFLARIRIVPNSAATLPAKDPETEVFISNLEVGGTSTRSINVTRNGTITIRLDAVANDSLVGVGLGIVGTDLSCALSQSVSVRAGSAPVFSLPVDISRYCVRVFDVGTITVPTSFSMTIIKPWKPAGGFAPRTPLPASAKATAGFARAL